MSEVSMQGRKRALRLVPIALLLAALIAVLGVAPLRAQTIPTITITNVVPDKTVTFQTANFPPNQVFTVTMGPFGTQGINGIVVGTLNSGVGGTLTATYNIPAQLVGSNAIAIRAQTAHAYPYYAYNWFYNNTSGTGGQPPPVVTPVPPTYTGFPTITICAVVQNTSVTFRGNNFPPNQTFTVTMGPFGTQGINGTVVGTLASGAGGTLTASYNIPANLVGSQRIAIRAQTAHAYPFVAYNWFWNTTATVCQ